MKYKSTSYDCYESGVLTAGRAGSNEGRYKNPRAIAYDDTTQELFIADSGNRRIVVCSSRGKYLRQFGEDIFEQPYGLVLAPDCIYATDIVSHELFKFTRPEYQLICRTGGFGRKEGRFRYPSASY